MYLEKDASGGFRALTPEELELVAGGSMNDTGNGSGSWGITITGSRYDPWSSWGSVSYNNYYYGGDDSYYYDYGDSGGGGGEESPPTTNSGNGMTYEEAEKALNVLKAYQTSLQGLLERYGPGSMLDLDGKLLPVHDVLKGLGTLIGWLEAGNLVYGLSTGDADAIDAIALAFGGVAAAAAAESGAVPLVAAAAIGFIADAAAEGVIRTLVVAANNVEQQYDVVLQDFINNHPVIPQDTNPYDFYRGLFGEPNPYRYEEEYNGGGGGGGGTGYHDDR